ncbi:velvet factor-domain-containing protein [Auriculariales sp. MPI-PUGE-AT-0066]|nr:velvet factor-domain-containing protein [Auriculariales sp. MPI-PUGE-AT-0066]
MSQYLNNLPSRAPDRPTLTYHTPGLPFYCTSGHFAGSWIRAEITEVQKGDRARKVGENGRDARGLDPPPVARVRLYECTRSGARLREADYGVLQNVTFTCRVALYPYDQQYDRHPRAFADRKPMPTQIVQSHLTDPILAIEGQYPTSLPTQIHTQMPTSAEIRGFEEGGRHQSQSMFGSCAVRGVVAPILNGEGHGKAGVYCAFDDLKIRQTGHFVLKYTVFLIDVVSQALAPGKTIPCIAECWGGVFAVFPSKCAPPLRPPTQLTQHLARHGVIARARRMTNATQAPLPARRQSIPNSPTESIRSMTLSIAIISSPACSPPGPNSPGSIQSVYSPFGANCSWPNESPQLSPISGTGASPISARPSGFYDPVRDHIRPRRPSIEVFDAEDSNSDAD